MDQKAIIHVAQEIFDLINKRGDICQQMNQQQREFILYSIYIFNFFYYIGYPIVNDDMYDDIVSLYEKRFEKLPNNMDFTLNILEKETKQVLLDLYENLERKQHIDRQQIELEAGNEILPVMMPSLDKLYIKKQQNDKQKIIRWIQNRISNDSEQNILISSKYDGTSILIEVEKEVKLYTRGDGKKGRNITHFLKYLNINTDVLQRIRQCLQCDFFLRGEIIMKQQTYEKKYMKRFANSRQLSTQVNKKYINDIKDIEIFNDLDIMIYQIQDNEQNEIINQKGIRNIIDLKNYIEQQGINGLNISNTALLKVNNKFYEQIEQTLSVFYNNQKEYQSDGIVLSSINDIDNDNKIAVKFQEETFQTTVKEVQWQISRRGKLTPVLIVDQVDVNGIQIQKVTAHNARYIQDYQIGKGTIITIVRSGDVIPYISEVLQNTQPGMPAFKYYWKDNNDIYVDPNETELMQEIIVQQLHFITEKLDVKNIGVQRINSIVKKLNITDIFGFLDLDKDDLMKLTSVSGFGEKIIQKIETCIMDIYEKAYENPIVFVSSLSIQDSVQEKTLDTVLNHFNCSLLQFIDYIKKDYGKNEIQAEEQRFRQSLLEIKGIQLKRAENIIQFRRGLRQLYNEQEYVRDLINSQDEKFKETQKKEKEKIKDLKKGNKYIYELHFVMTGTRDIAIKNAIKRNGGYVQDSYNKKTDVVILIFKQGMKLTQKITQGLEQNKLLYILHEKGDEDDIYKTFGQGKKEQQLIKLFLYEVFINL